MSAHAVPRRIRLPRWVRRPASPADRPQGQQPPAPPSYGHDYDATGWEAAGGASQPSQPRPAESTLLFRIPGLDGGPGITVPPRMLSTGPFPALTPNAGLKAEDFRRPAGQAPAPQHADPAELAAVFTPGFAETGHLERPYAPQPTAGVTAHMLAILGSVCIGSDPLTERLPYFAGDRIDDDGRRLVGITLGSGTKAWEVFETGRLDVLMALAEAVRQAWDKLVYADFRPGPLAPVAEPEAAVPVQDTPPAEVTAVDLPAVPAEPAQDISVAVAAETRKAIECARAVLERVYGPDAARLAGKTAAFIPAATMPLTAQLRTYDLILADNEPGLAAWHEALAAVAHEATERTAVLIRSVRTICGDATADYLAAGTLPAEPVPAAGGAQ